jgi:signal transduction histidine kinase
MQDQELSRYSLGVEKSIYDFSNSKEHIFDFPRSFLYDSYIYDANKHLIFSTDSKDILSLNLEKENNILYRKSNLNPNRLGAKVLIVSEYFSYKNIYQKLFLFALVLGIALFLLAIFFIRMSIYPFEKANSYLNAFFNDAMHELRTPIGVMQMNLEILKKKKDGKEIMRLLNSLNAITMIYEDIEYLIKYKYVDYRKESVDFSHFLRDRVAFFNDLANSKNIVIDTKIKENIFYEINRIELQRVIDNTISNAVKYSKKNTQITVSLDAHEETIIFRVQDNGVGIKDTKKIFTRYYRENEIKGGFGIGLSIVKNICQKNHILIEVQSKIDEGSIFIYTFS